MITQVFTFGERGNWGIPHPQLAKFESLSKTRFCIVNGQGSEREARAERRRHKEQAL